MIVVNLITDLSHKVWHFDRIGRTPIQSNLPTPWVGVWERINIGVFLLWVAMLAMIQNILYLL